MKDVAARAGVHVATVSRALRNCEGVSAAVRTELQQLAREMGYRPNPLVSALIRSRRNPHRADYHATLAILTPSWPAQAQAYREDYRQMIEGAERRAMGFGYRLEPFRLGESGMTAQRLTAILEARNIAGLIIPPLYEVQDSVPLEWTRWPVVAIGYSWQAAVPRVVHNHARAMHAVLAQCRQRGGRRPGLVLPRRVSAKVEDRWVAAYLLEQYREEGGVELLPPLLLREGEGAPEFGRWCRRHRPDVIIGLQHFTPLRSWLDAAGVRVPQEVALITLDQRDRGPRVAGIDQDYPQLGSLAIEQLVNIVERRDETMRRRATTVALDGVWREGPTFPRR